MTEDSQTAAEQVAGEQCTASGIVADFRASVCMQINLTSQASNFILCAAATKTCSAYTKSLAAFSEAIR